MAQTATIFLWSIIGAAICGAAGLAAVKSSPETIERIEKIPRNRYIGLIVGWFALLMCVPHAQAVAPDFMLKMLYPLAVIVPIAGFFTVDHAASRAVSGTLILCSYNMIHLAFELDIAGTWFFSVCGWLSGAAGIWCSGLPWTWRDIFRKCAANNNFRKISAGILFFFAAVYLVFCGVAAI